MKKGRINQTHFEDDYYDVIIVYKLKRERELKAEKKKANKP